MWSFVSYPLWPMSHGTILQNRGTYGEALSTFVLCIAQ